MLPYMAADPSLTPRRLRGRGATSNATGRFERFTRVADGDGWPPEDDDLPPLRTQVSVERPRSVITRNASPDIPFDRSINPYRGCEHGCIYCFARPSHAYLGFSAGLDFETHLIARPDAASVLEKELRTPGYVPRVMAIGTNTDPYQPIERDRKIMRGLLQVLSDYRHPVGVVTKGSLIERDADILGEMGQAGLAQGAISITTLDADLARKMEPRCPSPARRLKAMEALAKAGCPMRVSVAPLVPGLTDHELESILRSARDAGARSATLIPLRLPAEVSALWLDWLEDHFPDRVERVMSKLRDMHGGRPYDATFGKRMSGEGVWAELLQSRFQHALRRLGYRADTPDLRCDLFRCPARAGDQLSLF